MAKYIPERGHIVWIDFEPKKGKKIGKYRPALVLSSKAYHQQTQLLICSPISTSIRYHPTEVAIDNLESPYVVASNLIYTLDWKSRKIKFITESEPNVLESTLVRLIPLIGGETLLRSKE